MRRPLSAFVVVLGLLVIGVSSLYAESPATVKVPFPFVINGRSLPAGAYSVVPDSQDRSVLASVGEDRHAVSVTSTEWQGPPSTDTHPTLVFKKYGDDYFLWKVNLPDDDIRVIPAREVTKEVAQLAAVHAQQSHRGSTSE